MNEVENSEKPKDMKEMTLLEHLIELKERVKISLISIGVATLIMLVFPAQITSPWEIASGMYLPAISLILNSLKNAVKPEIMQLMGGTVTAPLEIYFIASLIFGVIFASPIVGYEIFKYIDPALYPHERRMIYPFMAAFLGLFAAGLAFGLYVITPFTFKAMLIFFDLVGAQPLISIMDFYMTILIVTLATGIVFTTPTILVLLVRVGLLSTKTIERNRKWIYGAMYIVAAIITPDGGMFTNLILLGVFVALLEGGILVAKRYEKRREQEEEEKERKEETPKQRYCKFCGKPIGDELFCPHCGRSQV